mgnify:CR=1 FL=1
MRQLDYSLLAKRTEGWSSMPVADLPKLPTAIHRVILRPVFSLH